MVSRTGIPATQNATPHKTSSWLSRAQSNPVANLALAVGLAAASAAVAEFAIPRGPTTAGQALVLMLGSLLVGLAAGSVTRSRWAALLVPVVHAAVLELLPTSLVGPTAGPIRLDSTYGILALIIGRGFYALVGLAPMVLGASLGAKLARLASGLEVSPRGRAVTAWAPTTLASAALVALAVVIALPARTPPILGTDGKPLAGSIAELSTVRLGGRDQAIMVRAYDPSKPVLLYLSGGPGQSDLAYSRILFDGLSREFVLVGWDQRGTGKSYPALDPTATMTLDRAVSDTVELARHLRDRFGEEKVYLLGESWGTTLAVLAVQRAPELFHAFIGSGQMVSQRETDRRLYHDVIALAQRNGETQLQATMRAFGEPPYVDTPYGNAFVMGQYDRLYKPYTPPAAYVERGNKAALGPYGVLGSEYSLVEKVNLFRGLIDFFTVMYPQLQGIDLRRDAPSLEVPVYVLDGAAELTARRDLALEWFEALQAPKKQMFTFENAGHSVAFEQYEAVEQIMLHTVLPQTYPGVKP
jgi:proline iminopeptidase